MILKMGYVPEKGIRKKIIKENHRLTGCPMARQNRNCLSKLGIRATASKPTTLF